MRYLGDDGYERLARETLDAVRLLAQAVSDVDGLESLPAGGAPESTVVCFVSHDPELDLFVLVDELSARGWHAQPQLAYADLPRSVHLTVTAAVASRDRADGRSASSRAGADGRSASSRAEEFPAVLRESVAAARALGPVHVPGELVSVVANLTPAQFTASLVDSMSAALGLGGRNPLPERQAMINALVELAPIPVREAMLAGFLSSLQRPTY
jgi:hypothetical protein